jgi:hypothetical protein
MTGWRRVVIWGAALVVGMAATRSFSFRDFCARRTRAGEFCLSMPSASGSPPTCALFSPTPKCGPLPSCRHRAFAPILIGFPNVQNP